jgi:hypothetical protein
MKRAETDKNGQKRTGTVGNDQERSGTIRNGVGSGTVNCQER